MELNIEKHTKKSLEFICDEADKHLSDTIDAIRSNSNRSFFLFGVYLSLASFSFVKVVEYQFEYLILLIGCTVAAFWLLKNISPNRIEITGASPSDILVPYFDHFEGDELEKELLATKIESYEKSILVNKTLVKTMSNRYIYSFRILLGFVVVFILVFSFLLFQCD